MKARLETMTGGFVQEVDLPPFLKAPEVLVWGMRFFVWSGSERQPMRYQEAFAYFIPITVDAPSPEAGEGKL